MNFYSKFINKLHIFLKPFYTLLHDDILFEWTPDLDKLFNQIKLFLSKDAELAIPNHTHPFYITVDASLIGLGAVLFQPNSKNEMQIISYNSRILTTQEQKRSTYDRELCAITFAPFPIRIYYNWLQIPDNYFYRSQSYSFPFHS